jgi:hypothetical protein
MPALLKQIISPIIYVKKEGASHRISRRNVTEAAKIIIILEVKRMNESTEIFRIEINKSEKEPNKYIDPKQKLII